MKKYIYFLIVLFSLNTVLFAQQFSADGGEPALLPAFKLQRSAPLKTIDECKALLTTAHEKYVADISPNALDLYSSALACIESSRPVIAKKPQSPKAQNAFRACSLATEAALLQINTRYNLLRIDAFHQAINFTLSEISKVYEAISYRERNKASLLRADLDAEKKNADLLRAEAEKMRDEADRKFQELQSSLIQVSNDARGTIISMSDILFEVNKANLTADLKTSLAKIAGILLVFKTSTIIIEGHTDNQGTKQYNQSLSEKRAENVKTFLVEQGLEESRLSSVGYGFSKPIAENTTNEGRQKNRRVDLIIQEVKQ